MRCAVVVNGFICADAACTKLPVQVLSMTSSDTCTATEFVILTDSEFQQNTASPFRLSVADGATLSALIVSVWVSAWVFKALVRVLYDPQSET